MTEFCSLATRRSGQSIVGTAAAETSAWLVVEYRQPWEAKGVERADFGPKLRGRLVGWLTQIEGLRPQLIRHPVRERESHSSQLTAYLGVSTPGLEQLRRLTLDGHDELAELDVPEIFAAMRRGERPEVGTPVDRPVVLVCTHGKRDRCCAKWGQPVHDALCGRDDIELWQTSHLGGHRFAATLLCLPQGICYGWLEPSDAAPLVEAHLRGEVYRLDRLRGRTALSCAAQAAEHFVREHAEVVDLDAVRVSDVEAGADGSYTARADVQGDRLRIAFASELLAAQAPPSCGKEPKPAQRYVLRSIDPLR